MNHDFEAAGRKFQRPHRAGTDKKELLCFHCRERQRLEVCLVFLATRRISDRLTDLWRWRRRYRVRRLTSLDRSRVAHVRELNPCLRHRVAGGPIKGDLHSTIGIDCQLHCLGNHRIVCGYRLGADKKLPNSLGRITAATIA